MHYRYRETVYHIDVRQTRDDKGEAYVIVDGAEQCDGMIPLVDDHKEHSVEMRILHSSTAHIQQQPDKTDTPGIDVKSKQGQIDRFRK